MSLRSKVSKILYKRAANRNSVFELFYSGQHSVLVEKFESDNCSSWTNDELHYVFASKAILGHKDESLLTKLAKPISRADLTSILKTQVKSEIEESRLGILNQPLYVHKSFFAASLGLSQGKKYFVETGTFTGQSLNLISGLFEHLYTAEASPELFRASQALFEGLNRTNISGELCDSRVLLQKITPDVANESVFFLDAHYSQGLTSDEYGSCPVIDEIRIILDKSPNALIVVDDIRTMSGKGGYPTLVQILSSLPSTLNTSVTFDQLVIDGNVKVPELN